MSNVIGGHGGMRYFQVPDSFVSAGHLRDLSGSTAKYYMFLLREMNRTGQVELEYTNKEIGNYTGIRDHYTADKARRELQEHGRIRLRKGPSGGFIHVMLSDSGEVFAPAKGRKSVRYHVRRERILSDTAKSKEPECRLPEIKSATSPATLVTNYCRVHRRETKHWEREGQLLCEECHPNPGPQKTAQPFRPPTARDLGFV
jgi:hypothetical protein